LAGRPDITVETYYRALVNAWREYWGEVPPWYASLEELSKYIDAELARALGTPVELALGEHLRYIGELARLGRVDYWYGGLDPKRRHWVAVVEYTVGPLKLRARAGR